MSAADASSNGGTYATAGSTLSRSNLEDDMMDCDATEAEDIALAALRCRQAQNNRAVIFALPTEIFFYILLEHQRLTLSSGPKCEMSMQWVRTTHVCSRWRTVAIKLPALWTDIDAQLPPAWLRIYLCRSRRRPIHVTVDHLSVAGDETERIIRAALKQTSRMKSIKLHGPADDIFGLISSTQVMKRPAPVLEVLDLATFDNEEISIPASGFTEDASSRLRKVNLNGVTFEWALARAFDALTELRISFRSSEQPPRCSEVVELLTHIPQLAILSISFPYDVIADHRVHEDGGNQSVPLPNLRELDLYGSSASLAALIGPLQLPMHISVTLELFDRNEVGIDALSAAVQQAWHSSPLHPPIVDSHDSENAPHLMPLLNSEIYQPSKATRNPHPIGFRGSSAEIAPGDTPPLLVNTRTVALHNNPPAPSAGMVEAWLSAAYPLNRIVYLRLDYDISVPWIPSLRRMTAVRSVELTGWSASGFVSSLKADLIPTSHPSSSSPPPPCLPQLRCLVLRKVSFSRHNPRRNKTTLVELVGCLNMRRHRAHDIVRLEQLEFESCTERPHMGWERLQAVAEKVIWDGVHISGGYSERFSEN